MVWGIEDSEHDIVGTIFDPDAERVGNQNVSLWLSNKLSPSINFTFHCLEHPAGHHVVILEIFSAQTIPTKFDNIAYIRIGDATPKLADYPEREAELIRKLQPFSWESGISSTFLTPDDVLSCLDYECFFTLQKVPVPSDRAEVMYKLKQDRLVAEDVGHRWKITNLGALLFARDITKFDSIRRKAIRIIKYDGGSKVSSASETLGDSGYAVFFSSMFRYINAVIPKNEQIRNA